MEKGRTMGERGGAERIEANTNRKGKGEGGGEKETKKTKTLGCLRTKKTIHNARNYSIVKCGYRIQNIGRSGHRKGYEASAETLTR